MKKLTNEKAQNIKAGKAHWHWICRDGINFTSKAYSTKSAADKAADKHIANYPAHVDRVSVFYCEKGGCKY